MLYSLFNKVYNMFSKKPVINTIKPDLEYSSYGISDKNDKELRINILLDIKNIKNTYTNIHIIKNIQINYTKIF